METCRLIAAMGTPLTEAETLHAEGFARHLEDVCQAGIDAMLVGGSMGNMQLLADPTYRDLMRQAVELAAGRCELFVGAGDTSFARTRDKIHWLNDLRVDGVALLTPYYERYAQHELIDYFQSLADESRWPIFLYDLPSRTGVALAVSTVLRLAEHPNIAGIKCSGDLGTARYLREQCPAGFRLQIAQANLLDVLIQAGLPEHVDGMYALAPQWTAEIREAALTDQPDRARTVQMQLSGVLALLQKYGITPTFTALMNARGIPGSFSPRPAAALPPAVKAELLDHPLVRKLCRSSEHTTPRLETAAV